MWVVKLTCVCDETASVVAELYNKCYKFLLDINISASYPSDNNLFEELSVLFKLISERKGNTGSFGCFTLDRQHLFQLGIGLTSFTPVLVQFNSL